MRRGARGSFQWPPGPRSPTIHQFGGGSSPMPGYDHDNGGGDDGNRTRVNGFAVPAVASANVRRCRLCAQSSRSGPQSDRGYPALLLPPVATVTPPRRPIAVLSPWSPARGRVLVSQPLHEGNRRIARSADLVTDGVERPGQALQMVEVQRAIAQAEVLAGRRAPWPRFYGVGGNRVRSVTNPSVVLGRRQEVRQVFHQASARSAPCLRHLPSTLGGSARAHDCGWLHGPKGTYREWSVQPQPSSAR
jgi:hypothetical protein